jgi:hypothetical protein
MSEYSMRSIVRAVAGLVLVVLTSACFVETEATLTDVDAKSLDERLVGTWYAGKGGEAMVLAIIKDEKNEGGYRAVFVNVNPFADGAIEGTRYSVWRTVVNGQSYLNVRRIGGSIADMPAVTIASYDIGADGSLVLRLMDTKQAIAAIEAGKLKGSFKKGQYVDEVKITSPRAELAAFVAGANRDALFATKTDPLRKMPDTTK